MARLIILACSVATLTLLATRELFALLAIVFIAAFLFAFATFALTGELIKHRKEKAWSDESSRSSRAFSRRKS